MILKIIITRVHVNVCEVDSDNLQCGSVVELYKPDSELHLYLLSRKMFGVK